eukprot:TRINITY_DN6549_c0_g1_i2.p1 TRINITY_DN6549_c0_g1~~TRINITY_DN6549_c0_g1_i2.p1  ORF type:complete len:315 (-),score=61.19 TRINITY_DN6549_c0_g1_i2:108-1025(-)
MSCSVLVIGAGGYIGEGVARAFRRAGYHVYGVTRSDKAADTLTRNEIVPVKGSLDDPSSFSSVIDRCSIIVDAVGDAHESHKFFDYIKTHKKHDIDTYKPLYIFTSGIINYYEGVCVTSMRPVDESYDPRPVDPVELAPRKKLEDTILATRDIRTAVIRPGFVYGGHGGVIASLFFEVDPKQKELVVEGLPTKRWSWVHVDDLGAAYVGVAQAGAAANHQLFNIAAQDNPTYEELKVAGAKAAGWQGGEVKHVPLGKDQERRQNWESNVIINPQKAYDLLGWRPHHVGVVAEIDLYYAAWKAARK